MVEIKTKEEILDKYTNKYMHTPVINAGILINVKRSVGEAMEEYADQKAKQEAKGMLVYFSFLASKGRLWGKTNDELWNEYQKSKIK